jgi:hypothetical protein
MKQLQVLDLSICFCHRSSATAGAMNKFKISSLYSEQLKQVHMTGCTNVLDLDCLLYTNRLTELNIEIYTGNLTSLQFILQKAPLRHLKLNHVNGYKYKLHEIELYRNNDLQTLTLDSCRGIVITALNAEQLEQVHITNCTDIIDFDCFFNTSRLTEFNLKDYSGDLTSLPAVLQAPLRHLTLEAVKCNLSQYHYIDLSRTCLQVIRMEMCRNLVITGFNTETLELDNINIYSNVLELEYGSSSFVDNPIRIERLNLNIKMYLKDVNVDKTTLVSLLQDNILTKLTMKGVYVDRSKTCPGMFSPDILSNSCRLTELSLQSNYFCKLHFSKQLNNLVHTLHQLQNFTLESVQIDDNALTVIPEMNSLTLIKLRYTVMSQNTWCTFVDSLLTLLQPVEVSAGQLQTEKCEYVRTNPQFKLIREVTFDFQFKSRI